MKNILFVMFVCLALAGCTGTEPRSGDTVAVADAALAEAADDLKPAPEFILASLAGGDLNSEDLKGKVIVVDFWATWCQPCIEEIPNFNALHYEQDDNVVMLGITVESGTFDDVEPYIAELGIEYPVVMGNEDVVAGFGGLIGFPTTFVVSPDWKIYKRYIGQKPDKKELIEQDIIDLTAEVPARQRFTLKNEVIVPVIDESETSPAEVSETPGDPTS